MDWRRPWRRMIWLGMLFGALGCANSRSAPVILSEHEMPQAVTKGEMILVPYTGYLMDEGHLFTCERECLRKAMGP